MPRDGRCIEVIGTYDPLAKPAVVQVKKERAEAWLAQGAQASDTVGNLLRQVGVKKLTKERKGAMETS
jgi:small subunit ribosomal protein S16